MVDPDSSDRLRHIYGFGLIISSDADKTPTFEPYERHLRAFVILPGSTIVHGFKFIQFVLSFFSS